MTTKSKNLYENCKVLKVVLSKSQADEEDKDVRMESSTNGASVKQDNSSPDMITTDTGKRVYLTL